MERLETAIQRDLGLYAFGVADVEAALAAGAAELVLLGPAYAEHRDMALASGASVIDITDVTPEGARFINGLTGIAALLRWSCPLPSTSAGALEVPAAEEQAEERAGEHSEFDFI